jgi:transketolase
LQVIRPADPNETAHAWITAVTHDGPTAIILSRQNVPSVTDGSAVTPGAAVIKRVDSPVATIIGTGSEVGTALDAAALLEAEGVSVNVVSLPSWDRFFSLSAQKRNEIIPTSLPRISVEAGSTFGWAAIASHSVGIDRFGASAPGNVVMEKLGITAANVASTVKAALAQ